MGTLKLIDVVLSDLEVSYAAQLGAKRHCEALNKALKDSHGFKGEDGLFKHVNGAGGEIAFGKAFGLYPGFTYNTFRAADIGLKIQVKTRSQLHYELMVRPDDADDEIFVLVRGVLPVYEIVGWMLGKEAKASHYRATHGDRPAAHFVWTPDLHDLSELRVEPVRFAPRDPKKTAPEVPDDHKEVC